MKAIDLIQGTDEWLDWRSKGIGASDVASIVGVSPFKTALQLYEEKSGLVSTQDPNSFMLRGQMYEEEARIKFTSKYEGVYEPICCEHDEYPHFKASLDGYNKETNSILEIKIPGRKNIDRAKSGEIPEYYKIQMDWQMFVTGSNSAYYCVYCPETGELYSIHYQRDDIAIERLKTAASKFWSDFTLGIEPTLQNGDFIEIDDPEYAKLANEYIDLHKQIKELEEKKKAIKPKILDFGDDGNFQGCGLKCVKVGGRVSYDLEMMKQEGIDLEKFKKISTNYYYRIDVA